MSDDPGQREVAYRLFAAEYDDANHSYSESEEERAPNYVVTPTGARVNRLFVVGVLTEVEQVSDDVLRGRVADPTGAFVLYAGQYQPDEQATLERTDPPAFVAVTGKADTFQPEDSDQVYTSIRPESINTVDAETRDRWTVQTAEQTLARVGHTATALSTGLAGEDLRETLTERGLDPALADGIPRALAHYDTTPAYLDGIRKLALDAARVVAGHRDEAGEMTASPDDPGDVTAHELVAATPETDLDGSRPALDESASETATGASVDTAGPSETGAEATPGTETTGDSRTATTSETTADPGPTSDSKTESGTVDTAESSATADPETESGTVDTAESSATADPETESGAKTTGRETATEVEAEPGDGTDDIAVETGADATGEELGEFDSGEFELPDDVREEVEEAEAEFGTSFQSGTEVEEPGEADIQTPETETAPEADATPTEPAESDAGTETTSAEPVDTEQVDTETAGGESADTEQVDTETAGRESVDTGPVDTETAGGESVDTGPVDTETAGGKSVDTGSTDVAEGNESESVEDPQAAVLAVMEDLDSGSGADRAAVLDETQERHGLTEEEVEEAVQGALMDGKCYEPDESSLKPI